MSNITTMVYDTGASSLRPKPTDDFGRASVSPQSVRTVTITHAYDNSGVQTERVVIHGVVTTFTYVDSGYSGLENRSRATCSNSSEDESLEDRLIAKLLTLLRNPPQTAQSLWWHVWKTVAEDPWLRSQQITIGRRLIRQPQAIEEMCQISTVHLGRLFERSPSLGLVSDELPLKFPRWIRRIIRRDFITWLRGRATEQRRLAPWPANDFVKVRNVQPMDELEIAAAMADLSALQREVVQMRSVGYRRSEIGQTLNLSIYQVDRIFTSCQQHLRRRLKDLRPD